MDIYIYIYARYGGQICNQYIKFNIGTEVTKSISRVALIPCRLCFVVYFLLKDNNEN